MINAPQSCILTVHIEISYVFGVDPLQGIIKIEMLLKSIF